MKDIESLLRSAKPPVPDLPDDFSTAVMHRLEQDKVVPLKTTPFFIHPKLGLPLGLITLIAATLLFSYNSYELLMNGSLELLFFGTRYLGAFLGYLPWDLIIPSFLLAAFSAWMIRKTRLFKRGLALTVIISYLITGVGGAALASAGLNEQIESGIVKKEDQWPWLRIFFNQRANQFIHHPNFKMGKVEEIAGRIATITTPHGDRIQIQLPPDADVQTGQVLRISGEGDNAVFSAQKVHVCNPNRVMRYFGHREHHHQQMMPQKSCCSSSGMMH